MAANKRWVFALALGMLIAGVLLAVAPIYHRAMVDLGLRDAVARDLVPPTGPDGLLPYDEPSIQQPQVGVSRVEFAGAPVIGQEGTDFGARVTAAIEARLGWLATSHTTYIRFNQVLGSRPGEPERPFAEVYVQSLEGWEQRVRVIDGQLPGVAPAGDDLEIVINETATQLAGLKPGDRFQLNIPCAGGFEDCDPVPEPVTVVVAAVVDPVIRDDPFWASGPATYFEPNFTDTPPGLILPILLSTEQFALFVDRLPDDFKAYRAWYSFGDPEKLTRGTVSRALDDVDALETQFAKDDGTAFSPMEHTVREFERAADHQRTPLTILLIEIAAIALFYLILVSSAVLDRQARQIALLRSRGTSAGQVLLSFLFEARLIAAAVAVTAPFIAGAIISVLGVTPIFEEVTGGDPLDVTILPSAFLFSTAGALLGVAALMAPAALAARRGLVSQRQAETRPGKPFFQRYFLDVAFTAIALLLLWEMNERGSVYEPSSTGGVTSDPLLLASPALIVFAGAMIFLRFYPIVLRGLGWLAFRGPGVSPSIGISTLVRRPGQYGQLALLLLMAVSVGTFAASYSSTTDRSLEDRADFEAGVEFRALVSEGTMGSNGPRTDAALADLPYQQDATAVLRTPASVSLSGSGRNVQLLGIDPEVAGEMVWFRDDFADTSLDGVLFPLRGGGGFPGIEAPGEPVAFHAWVYAPEIRDSTTVYVRLEDAAGTPFLVDIGSIDFTGWKELTGAIAPVGVTLEMPLRLTAVIFTAPPARGITGDDNSIVFDDLAVSDAAGNTTVIEDFESSTPTWRTIVSSSVNPDSFEVTTDQKQSGARGGKVSLAQGTSTARRGIYPISDRVPLPIAASDQMLRELGLGEGSQTVLLVGNVPVPVVVGSTYELFPTLFSEDGASALINRDDLNAWLRTWATTERVEMNEAWLTLQPGTTGQQREELAGLLARSPFRLDDETVDRAALYAEIDQDPLLAAGGTGILAIGFVSTLVLLTAAAAVVLFTDAERRRPEMAVMRALGFSRGQTARMLALEYGLLIFFGLALGAVLGRQLGDRMLSFLNVTEDGEQVEPEFILQTDWALLGLSALAIVAVFSITLAIVLAIARRFSAGQVLRTD